MAASTLILIANPGSKRCDSFRREFDEFRRSHSLPMALELVSWADVVPTDGNLDGIAGFDRPAIVRLESPGKDDRVYRQMLEAGDREDLKEPATDWGSATIPNGMMVRPGLWYRGFSRVLRGLRQSFNAKPHLTPTACPLSVAEMFNKNEAAIRLRLAGVSTPDTCSEQLKGPSAVLKFVTDQKWSSAYVKLNTGSSAMGIVLLHTARGFGATVALTTLAERNDAFFHSRRISRLSGPGLDRAIQFILDEGACIQAGIPKARIDGRYFDVRVVCVHGKAVCTMFRASANPITNLHLGGQRGEFESCRASIPNRAWLDAMDDCINAAACFDSSVVGVDLAFEEGFRQHYILEVNAFGDFFPGWTNTLSQSIHAIELEAAFVKAGSV